MAAGCGEDFIDERGASRICRGTKRHGFCSPSSPREVDLPARGCRAAGRRQPIAGRGVGLGGLARGELRMPALDMEATVIVHRVSTR